MIINESGLVRAMKQAYRTVGYTVYRTGDYLGIYTHCWYVYCQADQVPRKVLGAIVEHMGMLPAEGQASSIEKDEAPQMVLPEIANQDIEQWMGGWSGEEAAYTPVTFQGYRIVQELNTGACYGFLESHLDIVFDVYAIRSTELMNRKILYKGEEGGVVIMAARTSSDLMEPWERDIWARLEGTHLAGR